MYDILYSSYCTLRAKFFKPVYIYSSVYLFFHFIFAGSRSIFISGNFSLHLISNLTMMLIDFQNAHTENGNSHVVRDVTIRGYTTAHSPSWRNWGYKICNHKRCKLYRSLLLRNHCKLMQKNALKRHVQQECILETKRGNEGGKGVQCKYKTL